MSDASKAVFLSYASQDAEAARRICDALRGAGIEVWFDQSELRGGDAWDTKIRQQIKECALFLPIISANTQARPEGYFRLEWKLADRRTDLMGKSKSFLVPICIDETRDAEADVPDSFLTVQWTRLPGGETTPKFCERVKVLLGGSSGTGNLPVSSGSGQVARATSEAPRRVPVAAWIAAAVVTVAALLLWAPWRPNRVAASRPTPAAVASGDSSELARSRARIHPDRWQKQDFDAISSTVDRLIQANQDEADAWALRSIINSLQVMRNFDSGTKPLEVGKSAAERALRLAPNSPLGELALGMHLVAMFSRGSDVSAARPHIERGLAGLPPDSLTRYADLTARWLGYEFEDTQRTATTWLQEEPRASFPAWILAQMHTAARRPDEAEKWANQAAAADNDITGIRSLVTIFEARYYLRADLSGARAALDRLAAGARPPHRLLYARWLLAMAERQWDQALQEVSRIPEPIFFDRNFHGPKALLVGLAHQAAGRTEPALAQFRESERLLRAELTPDPDNDELRAVLAVTLASAGRADEARGELAAVEPLMRGRAPSVYTGGNIVLIAQAYGALGDVEKMTPWLRKLLAEPSALPFTPASLKSDPRFARVIAHPSVQALLAEFAHLDQPAAASAKSIAVLAFKTLGGDKQSEYFSEGISEELLNALATVPELRVAARASAFYFKDKNATTQEMGRQLNVAYLVDGSVQSVGSTARVTARLSRADTGELLWSRKFEGELKNIFKLQDEIAGGIAENLKLKLGASARATKSVNPEAYRLLLEARHFWNQRTDEGFVAAEAALRKALALDPRFAEAHAGLADVAVMRAVYRQLEGETDVADDLTRTRVEAQRALALDASLPEPPAALAYASMLERKLADAERGYQQVLAVNPNHSMVHTWHGVSQFYTGRLDLALEEFERAIALDPLHFIHLHMASDALALAGRLDEALALDARAAALRSYVWPPNRGELAALLWQKGRKEEAVAAARFVRQLWPRKPRWFADGNAIWVLQQAGLHDEAAAYAAQVLQDLPETNSHRGLVLVALGKFGDALPYLERCGIMTNRNLFWAPMWDRWRDDPRFQQLLVKLGCAEEYKVARATLTRMQQEKAGRN